MYFYIFVFAYDGIKAAWVTTQGWRCVGAHHNKTPGGLAENNPTKARTQKRMRTQRATRKSRRAVGSKS